MFKESELIEKGEDNEYYLEILFTQRAIASSRRVMRELRAESKFAQKEIKSPLPTTSPKATKIKERKPSKKAGITLSKTNVSKKPFRPKKS